MGRTVGIVVARMGSSRVPGKSLLDIAGRSLIGRMFQIGRAITGLDDLCLATSTLAIDDALAQEARAAGVTCVRGDPEYVLDRLNTAAQAMRADVVVYLGGDCPLLDPALIDEALRDFHARPCDYLNNYDPPTFPEGFDVNIATYSSIRTAVDCAVAPSQRIHAFSYLTRHPEKFSIRNFARSGDLSAHHWSVDYPEDVTFVRTVYERLGVDRPMQLSEILDLVARDPEVAELDRALLRPVVAHAFWNSPGILRDMNADIGYLCTAAQAAFEQGEDAKASVVYEEILRIAGELHRGVSERLNARMGAAPSKAGD